MSAEFDKVQIKIGYQRFYASVEDAIKILRMFSQVNLLRLDTNYSAKSPQYSAKSPQEIAVPMEAGFVVIENADPGEAFARIVAGETIRNKK